MLTFIPSIDVPANRICLEPHMQPLSLYPTINLYSSSYLCFLALLLSLTHIVEP